MNKFLLRKAFRIIRRNYGCPGNNKVSIKDIKSSYGSYEDKIWNLLIHSAYPFESNPKLVNIDNNKRFIYVYNIEERWIQEYLKLEIENNIEAVLHDYVYAYRMHLKDRDSYNYILKNNPNYILRVDIKNYFPSIDTRRIYFQIKNLNIDPCVEELIFKSSEHCKHGLPVGNVLSCILSNLYLTDFDDNFPQNYTRYSDDMMFAYKHESEHQSIIASVVHELQLCGLELNLGKSVIITKPTLEKLI